MVAAVLTVQVVCVLGEDRGKMEANKFNKVGAYSHNPKWDFFVERQNELYSRSDDIRSEFARDYNRILHSTAYRRLKHKTQVFFATKNDHICTRIEHVNHVASVSHTISHFLGLNTELTDAIAIGHDLGHAPFGHEGEIILREIIKENIGDTFWHEKNSLCFVDKLETLSDPHGKERNLNLTYAVRDGIVSHCGEVNENAIFPRDEFIELEAINKPSQHSPYTWEGCVVKIADKISYLGRDIEDALTLSFLSRAQLKELKKIIKDTIKIDFDLREINNTVLMHDFIIDLCSTSDPDCGVRFSNEHLQLINAIKRFNYDNIYFHPRLMYFKRYARLIICTIFEVLVGCYKKNETLASVKNNEKIYPVLMDTFSDWLIKYSNIDLEQKKRNKYENDVFYQIDDRNDYIKAIVDYLSGMTDSFALRIFMEITSL